VTDVVLHIGTGKTGTSSIQKLLGNNRPALRGQDVLYPRTPGRYRHVRLGLMITPPDELDKMIAWSRIDSDDPVAFQRQVRDELLAELRESDRSRLLVSNESLYGAGEPALRNLRTFLDGFATSVRVVVYLRRQDDHLLSRYQQRIKTGTVDRIEEYAEADLARTYDYARRLSLWERVVGADETVVRPFESGQFHQGSLYQDFLDSAGIDIDASTLKPVERTNESLDAELVELLRVLNMHRVENRGARIGQIDNRPLLKTLFTTSQGPTLGLPDDVLDRLMARWEQTNAAVARDHLGRADGVLFHSAKRSASTTTEQRLDPARLDHFFELLHIPADEHAQIRAIAVREDRRA